MIGFCIGLAIGALIMHGAWKLNIWLACEDDMVELRGQKIVGTASEDVRRGQLVVLNTTDGTFRRARP